ncbi:MAG: site-specific DNA-methyltransferase [Brevinema sp.]
MDNIFLNLSEDRVLLDFPCNDPSLEETAKPEIAHLTWKDSFDMVSPKKMINWKRYTTKGSEAIDTITQKDNFLFKGNNFEVLSSILPVFQASVKLIYIDPPYNTGNTFIYKDKLSRSLWLTFMKSRIVLAKKFLTQDGILVIQCDDNEQAYLKVLLDEIFGEECFIGMVTVLTNPGGRDYRSIARTHEYLLFYGQTADAKLNPLPREKEFPFQDKLGGFELRSLRNGNIRFHIGNRPNLCYPFYVNPHEIDENGLNPLSLQPTDGWVEVFPRMSQGLQTVWRWGREKSSQNININLVARKSGDSYLIFEKYRKQTRLPRSVWDDKDFQTSKGTRQLKEMFGASVFDYPKPEGLIRHIIQLGSNPGDRVLDFFLGSGTTASAALKENRTWIGIEQMDHLDTVAIPRLQKVLAETGGDFITANITDKVLSTSELKRCKFYQLASNDV